jgi:hypothetical protein
MLGAKLADMHPEQQRELEQEIDQALRGLPDLQAPASLRARVMLAIERRRALRWYNQPLQNWPMPLRVTAIAILLGLFGGLCFASWRLTRAAGVSAAMQEIGGMFSGVTTVWNVVNTLLSAIVMVVKHLGTAFMIGCLVIAALGYAMCLGLGTAWVRLALARR